jgi:hypothetical protein
MLFGLPLVNFLFFGGGFGNAIFLILLAKSEAPGGGWSIVVAYDILVVDDEDCDGGICIVTGRGAKDCILAMLARRMAVVIARFMFGDGVMRWCVGRGFKRSG